MPKLVTVAGRGSRAKRTRTSKRSVLKEARALVEAGKPDRARLVLLEHDHYDAIPILIPESKELREAMKGPLKRLRARSALVRRGAAKDIEKCTRMEGSIFRSRWLADPRTTALLTEALQDEDEEVVEQCCQALGWIMSGHLRLRDQRALDALLPLLENDSAKTRVGAVIAVASLQHTQWLRLVPLCSDRALEVRRMTLRALRGAITSGKVQKRFHPKLKMAILARLEDRSAKVRLTAARASQVFDDEDAIQALDDAIKRERTASLRRALENIRG